MTGERRLAEIAEYRKGEACQFDGKEYAATRDLDRALRHTDCPPLAVALFGSFGDGKVIDDPYCESLATSSFRISVLSQLTRARADGGPNGFEKTYQQCVQYSEGLLKEMGYGSSDGGKL